MKLKKTVVVGCVLLIIFLVGCVMLLNNTPEKKQERQLAKGEKYIEEKNYEKAIEVYEEVIHNNATCMQAYDGKLKAYLSVGSKEDLKKYYEEVLNVINGLDSVCAEENRDIIIGLLLCADDVYESDYELVLKTFDEVSLIDKENEIYRKELINVVENYVTNLMEKEDYETIKTLADKYTDEEVRSTFDDELIEIAEIESANTVLNDMVDKIASFIEAEDYAGLLEYYHADETKKMLEENTDYPYIRIFDGDNNEPGLGVGIYFSDKGKCFFYYGDYVENVRNGTGRWFTSEGSGDYELFTGAWSNDAPNGQGEVYEWFDHYFNDSDEAYGRISGNFVNGLSDGDMMYIFHAGGVDMDLCYSANVGVPTVDMTETYNRIGDAVGGASWKDVPEHLSVYALDIWGSTVICDVVEKGKTVGVSGFRSYDREAQE